MKPKLALRDLFWLVTVCALSVGWWLDRSEISQREDDVNAREASIFRMSDQLNEILDNVRRVRDNHPELKDELGPDRILEPLDPRNATGPQGQFQTDPLPGAPRGPQVSFKIAH